jgi:hypothetical protein
VCDLFAGDAGVVDAEVDTVEHAPQTAGLPAGFFGSDRTVARPGEHPSRVESVITRYLAVPVEQSRGMHED